MSYGLCKKNKNLSKTNFGVIFPKYPINIFVWNWKLISELPHKASFHMVALQIAFFHFKCEYFSP